MVLVSLLLVLLAAVALVIGLLQSGLTIIYVSIGCSVVAGVLLAVAVVRGRPQAVSTGSAPRAAAAPPPPPPPSTPTATETWQPAPSQDREPAMARAGAHDDATTELRQSDVDQAADSDDDDLPISGYDRLRATEVLPLLANLDAEELAAVRAHEVSGRNRFMVLSRIDRELETRGEPAWDAGDDWDDAEAGRADGRTTATEVEEEDEVDEGFEQPVPTATPPMARRGPAPARAARGATSAASGSILDDYEHRKVLDILPRLPELDGDQLQQVRRRELAGQRRMMIVNRVDRLLADAPAAAAAPAPAAARRAPVRKAPAKKVAAAKKAPAKRTPAKKAAPAKSPAKKAPAKKAPAKKAPAKRATKRS